MTTLSALTILRRSRLASILLGSAVLLGGVIFLDGADAAAGSHRASGGEGASASNTPEREVYLCTASITYKKGSTVETYEKTFKLRVGVMFEDDFSSGLKEKIFTATATPAAHGIVFDFEYFSDVSALASVELDSSLTLRPGQDVQESNGHHDSYQSSSGSYDLTYSFTCERR